MTQKFQRLKINFFLLQTYFKVTSVTPSLNYKILSHKNIKYQNVTKQAPEREGRTDESKKTKVYLQQKHYLGDDH